ncbi:hypothetical protein H696_04656 [Fonticula alba]|uniref:RGS domain-containing protein n=1 Tax=Fonticula alba TaxID=691883 RepID=A0A058Z4M1_FONAL|nr:hypothetical protein H696_04656 [Fonticula alba]KCV69239.1 hypothetical protein H696_04656 [Fonticula alba]|eukprot:XP_009496810.1 hypothetical protein H696_04656 [Fonticula alba]
MLLGTIRNRVANRRNNAVANASDSDSDSEYTQPLSGETTPDTSSTQDCASSAATTGALEELWAIGADPGDSGLLDGEEDSSSYSDHPEGGLCSTTVATPPGSPTFATRPNGGEPTLRAESTSMLALDRAYRKLSFDSSSDSEPSRQRSHRRAAAHFSSVPPSPTSGGAPGLAGITDTGSLPRSLAESRSDSLSLDDVLGRSDLRTALRVFAGTEFAEENVFFLEELALLKRFPEWRLVQEILNDYIRSESPLALNIEHRTRERIIEAATALTPEIIKAMPKNQPITLFDPAAREVRSLIETNILPKFKHALSRVNIAPTLSVVPPNARRVVIVGGGILGAFCARLLDAMPRFHVTLVDTKEYFELTPSITTVMANPSLVENHRFLHTSYVRNGRVVIGYATEVCHRQVRADGQSIPYDYLVIATGATYNSQIRGNNVTTSYRTKKLNADFRSLEQSRSVLIIGGGSVGVELAAEFAERFPTKHIMLVSSSPFLLRRLPKKAHRLVAPYLESLGVELILGERVVNLDTTGRRMETDTGRIIECDKFYLATGQVPQTRFLKAHFSNLLDTTGFIRTRPTLQVFGFDHIFTGGDVANLKVEKLAFAAASHGVSIARNICRIEKGRAPLVIGTKGTAASPGKPIAQVVSLGQSSGLFAMRGSYIAIGMRYLNLKKNFERDMMLMIQGRAPISALLGKVPSVLPAATKPMEKRPRF